MRLREPALQPCSGIVCDSVGPGIIVSDCASVLQLAGAEAGKPACMALLSAFEAGRQPRLAMQVLFSPKCQLWMLNVKLHMVCCAHNFSGQKFLYSGAESTACV